LVRDDLCEGIFLDDTKIIIEVLFAGLYSNFIINNKGINDFLSLSPQHLLTSEINLFYIHLD